MKHYDILIIGGGAAGLSLAAGAAQMGLQVALFEGGKMGGECLNNGCVPSKRLIAIGKHEPQIDPHQLPARINQAINAIAPNDSPERFRAMGVNVVQEKAHFVDKHSIMAGDQTYYGRYIAIATGSQPAIPNINGLEKIAYYTNENIFTLNTIPQNLLVIGGGFIGLELAMAWRALGAGVAIMARSSIGKGLSQRARHIITNQCLKHEIQIYEHTEFDHFDDKFCHTNHGAIAYSHVLLAVGRTGNHQKLGLEKIGIMADSAGIATNEYGQTNIPHIYAMGDCRGEPFATHKSGADAGAVLRNIALSIGALGRAKTPNQVPFVLFTQPEVAFAGRHIDNPGAGERVLIEHLHENDRAICDELHETPKGYVAVVVDKRARVKGVEIVAPNAGDLLTPWLLMMGQGLPLRALAGITQPYPTMAEISKRIAGQYYKPVIFGKTMKRAVRWIMCIKKILGLV